MTFALLAAAALAGTFHLTTDAVVVGPEGAAIGVTNTTDHAIIVHGAAFAHDHGRDVPSADLAISPPFLTIQPGATEYLDVDPKRGRADHELAYTVAVEELHLGVGYATLPVFLAGSRGSHPALDVNVSLMDGTLAVDVANVGDAHLEGYTVEVSASEARYAALRQAARVLAGASRRESFFVPPEACAELTTLDVRVTSRLGSTTRTVPVDGNACARLAQASLYSK